MAEPTEEQLQEAFALYQKLYEGFVAHFKETQKGINNHHELARQTVIAGLQIAAVMGVDLHYDQEKFLSIAEQMFDACYKQAPRFG